MQETVYRELISETDLMVGFFKSEPFQCVGFRYVAGEVEVDCPENFVVGDSAFNYVVFSDGPVASVGHDEVKPFFIISREFFEVGLGVIAVKDIFIENCGFSAQEEALAIGAGLLAKHGAIEAFAEVESFA